MKRKLQEEKEQSENLNKRVRDLEEANIALVGNVGDDVLRINVDGAEENPADVAGDDGGERIHGSDGTQ